MYLMLQQCDHQTGEKRAGCLAFSVLPITCSFFSICILAPSVIVRVSSLIVAQLEPLFLLKI